MSEYVLEVLDGELAGKTISLDRDRLTLGRRANNDVVLKDEKASGNHAEIVREGDAWVLRDLDSRNGTRLDGREVREIGLSPGDVFQVGLTSICFRRASDPPARAAGAGGAGEAEGFAVHRVDAARLQRVKGGGMLPLVAALLIVAGAGVWVWLRYGGEREPGATRSQRQAVAVPGNLIAAEVSTVDQEAAFDLAAGPGAGFTVGGPAASGRNALTVTRGDGPAFAVARLREPLRVIADDLLEVSAQIRCEQGAQVGLRVQFFASREEEPLTLTAASPLASATDWQPLRATLAVPAGLDRARIEVLALLPQADSAASVDDLAVVRGGAKAPVLSARNGVRLLTSGAAAALVLAQDVLVHAVRPVLAPGSPLAEFAAGARATLAEAGGTLQGSVQDDTFTLAVHGVDAFAREFDGSAGLLVRAAADAPFAPTAAEFEGTAAAVLIGSGRTRLLLAPAAPAAVQGRGVAGGYLLAFTGVPELRLVVGFEDERRQARERVRAARAHAQDGRFGDALPPLQEVMDSFPHDDAVLAEAQQLRAEIQDGLRGKLDALAQDLDTARFFAARAGLVRVLAELDALVAAYGAEHASRDGVVDRLRTEATKTIADLDAQAFAQRAPGLRQLAAGLQAGGHGELASLIEEYVRQQEGKQ